MNQKKSLFNQSSNLLDLLNQLKVKEGPSGTNFGVLGVTL